MQSTGSEVSGEGGTLPAGRPAAHIHGGQAQQDANRNLTIRACRLIHPHTRIMADPSPPAQSKNSIRAMASLHITAT
jgi:hypothetical protein